MNIYDRILNILLEARVEMFIQDRLDEISHKQMVPGKGGKVRTTSAKAAERYQARLMRAGGQTTKIGSAGGVTTGEKSATTQNPKGQLTSVQPEGGSVASVRR